MTTHYDVLGVDHDASHAEVRAAYRRAARRLHPDAGGDGATVERMVALNEAWRVVGDPGRRREYDRVLGHGAAGSAVQAAAAHRSAPAAAPAPRFNPFARYQNPPRFPWRPVLVGCGLGVIVALVFSALSPVEPIRPVDGLLLPGECVQFDGADGALETLCDGAQDGVVDTIVVEPLRCPQGTEPHAVTGGSGIACVRV